MYKNRLKQLRNREGLEQRRVAEILNVSYSLYCDYENEKQIMPLKHINSICNYFNVSIDYIFDFSNNKNYKVKNNSLNKNLCAIRLKEFRKSNKLTQKEVIEKLQIGNGTLTGYENGKYTITSHALYDLCKNFKISADYLLARTDRPKYIK